MDGSPRSSVFFFFKQKTAYEMRISDWSSDVCSSDLVHRGHQAAFDADRVVQHLGNRRQAVGRAACIGNDDVVTRQRLMVHAIHDGFVHAFCRSGNDDATGTGRQVRARLFLVREEACALKSKRSEEHTTELQSLM